MILTELAENPGERTAAGVKAVVLRFVARFEEQRLAAFVRRVLMGRGLV